MSLNLHEVLKNSYASRNKQKGAFKNQGYVYDSNLSNDNEQVYYNPSQRKLLFSVTGTHNLRDYGTDLWLAAGKLKDTKRYQEAKNILHRAKQKYHISNATLAGHSLGGLVQYIGNRNDKVYTLDKGATIGQKIRSNEKAYRTSGDLVSVLNANNRRMKTLKNPHIETGNFIIDSFNAHSVDNIKNSNIKI